jgi:predicted ABC-type transport system involved in lysophospholipase L1 biosynthesis ATPase subunit
LPFAKSRSRPDRSQRKAKLHKRIVSTNYAVPTGNLDSKTSQDVLSLLKVSSQKFAQTIVMITHNEEIAQMADRIIRIEDGRIVSQN